jgi:predicted membrane channel-forming protein YqfA (hemolysin III family)
VHVSQAPGSAQTPTQAGAAHGTRYGVMRAAIRRRLTAEHLVVLVAGLLVLVVHDVGYLLSQPFWNDETWVAVTTRFPLAQLPATTSSTPIGWSLLLRLFTVSGEQTSRLLPLAFAGAAVVVGYWLARRLSWPREDTSVAAGLLAAAGVLLVPGMLVRDDLKQFTADACMALLTLALTSRLEREWSRAGLAALSLSAWGGMLFSSAAAFVGVAAFAAICIVQLARRSWHRLIEAAVAAAVTAVLMAGVFEAFDARADTPALTAFFGDDYLPVSRGLHGDLTFVVAQFEGVGGYFGLGHWWLAVPLVAAGLVTIFRLGRPATAVAIAALWPEMLALSALKIYPFLNQPTSTFLYALMAVVAAIGVAGVCSALRPWLRTGLAAGLAAVAVVAFVVGARPYVRSHDIPPEDIRDQALYVASHYSARNDVILVNLSSNWGFAYYWPFGEPGRRPTHAVLQDYEAYFPDQPRIVVARNNSDGAVAAALAHALALARQHSCARIWLVRAFVQTHERNAWKRALSKHGVTPQNLGHGGLSVIQPASPRCR